MQRIICAIIASLVIACGKKNPTKFAITMTTIPPRFNSIHHVINSWFNQEISPAVVVVFVPSKYKVFKQYNSEADGFILQNITSTLNLHFSDQLNLKRLLIKSLDLDWGPASKYVGVLQYFDNKIFDEITHWVIGDDDVRYSNNVLTRYDKMITSKKYNKMLTNSIGTNFKVEGRVQVQINHEKHIIPHIQGVDTVLIASNILHQQKVESGSLSFHSFIKGLRHFHDICASSFYQDDYIFSFFVFLSNLSVKSLWNGQKVAHHINDVSTSNQQMHLHPRVNYREEETKICISTHAEEIVYLLSPSHKTKEL